MRNLIDLGIMLIFIGFILIAASIIKDVLKRKEDVKVEGGGVVFIGPIPIVFGTSSKAAYLSVLITILILIYIIVSVKL